MAKEKAQTQRSYDEDGYKKRAACVCVRNETETEVLLISSTRDKQRWIIPGGGIERNEDPQDAAAREVLEEAGVQGRLGRLLGVFENNERKNRTSVYLLIVDKELAEWEEKRYGRERKWFGVEEAKRELEMHKPVQGTYLNLLKGFQSNNNNNSTATKTTTTTNSTNNQSVIKVAPVPPTTPTTLNGMTINDGNNNNNNSNTSRLVSKRKTSSGAETIATAAAAATTGATFSSPSHRASVRF